MDTVDDNKKLEVIHETINKLIEERSKKSKEQEDDEETILFSRLLHHLDSLKKDAKTTSSMLKCPTEKEEPSALAAEAGNQEVKEMEMVEIVKELRSVKRQNVITHCLLTVMIIVTTVWQVSEASILFGMKEKVTHPIRSVGDMIARSLKLKGKKPTIDAPPLPPISVPELPRVDMPYLSLNGSED